MADKPAEVRPGPRDILDELTEEELTKLYILVGTRVAEKKGNPYKSDTTNHLAFSAMFGGKTVLATKNMVPYFKKLDPMDAEAWSADDIRAWLYRH